MKINPAVQGGAEQGSARVGRGQGASLPMDAFQALLNQVESRTRFSAHAKARIEQRGVDLTADDLARIDDAVDRMAAKGVRDALIYMSHGLAMVVSVKNRTVITALDDASAKENIFTNIDMYITASKAQPVTLSLSDGTKQTVTSGTYTIGRSMPKVTSFGYFDTLGRKHESIVFLEKALVTTVTYTDEDGNTVTKKASTWIARVGNPEVKNIDGSKTKHSLPPTTISFDEDGVLRAGALGGIQTVTPDPDSHVTTPVAPPPTTTASSSEVATLSAEQTAPNGARQANDISLQFANDESPLTQYAGYDTIKAAADGYASGTLASVSFDSAGVITGVYTNGVRRAEAQVAVAVFANPSGLTKLGGNLYQDSNNSNVKAVRGQTVESAGAKITPSSLEMSNVDLADQFSDMIITQRGFQSNSKIITVGDEILETLINMKR